ncbi:MAG: SMP-30/gluconolactonase/LRE family protein [Longimicrobiales bacterium]
MTVVSRTGAALLLGLTAAAVSAQAPQQPTGFTVGNPLGLPIIPTPGQTFQPMSSNVKVYGAIFSAESCTYDPVRNLIVVPNRNVGQAVQDNNAWISFINHDGSVHTARWIGVNRNELVLNEPLGSDVEGGILYLADRDGGLATVVIAGGSAGVTAGPPTPQVSVVRKFDMATGRPAGEIRVETATGFNDIEVASDGTIYGTVSGPQGHVYRITPQGQASVFIPNGAPLNSPNGVAIDGAGNIVIVNSGDAGVLTYDRSGRLILTEQAAQPGSDGIVIMQDGTKYVSSVQQGGVSRIRPGQAAELIAQNIPNPASMCYDSGANQLVIPMNANNALAFIPLTGR